MKHRIELYEQDQDGLHHCVLSEHNGTDYVEVLETSNAKAIYALIDCKRQGIMAGKWRELDDSAVSVEHDVEAEISSLKAERTTTRNAANLMLGPERKRLMKLADSLSDKNLSMRFGVPFNTVRNIK